MDKNKTMKWYFGSPCFDTEPDEKYFKIASDIIKKDKLKEFWENKNKLID